MSLPLQNYLGDGSTYFITRGIDPENEIAVSADNPDIASTLQSTVYDDENDDSSFIENLMEVQSVTDLLNIYDYTYTAWTSTTVGGYTQKRTGTCGDCGFKYTFYR